MPLAGPTGALQARSVTSVIRHVRQKLTRRPRRPLPFVVPRGLKEYKSRHPDAGFKVEELPGKAPSKRSIRLMRYDNALNRPLGNRMIKATYASGGTSKGLVIWRNNLPPRALWNSALGNMMGSPDISGRQRYGMGSGTSATSQVCIIRKMDTRDIADVEVLAAQINVENGEPEFAANAGNMLSIVGPIVFDEAMFWEIKPEYDPELRIRTAKVRVMSKNTGMLVDVRFRVTGATRLYYTPEGAHRARGEGAGRQSRIYLTFIRPGGTATGSTFPTANRIDTLTLPDGSTIEATLVDIANPAMFVRVSDLGIDYAVHLNPAIVQADAPLRERLQQIRDAGAVAMGLDPEIQSVPKLVLLFPQDAAVRAAKADIRCLVMSMGQPHTAMPLTMAVALGAAARLPGTIPNEILAIDPRENDTVVVGHPTGKIDVKSKIENGEIVSVDVWRYARVLMEGIVRF